MAAVLLPARFRKRRSWVAPSMLVLCSACWVVFAVTIAVAVRFSGDTEWWKLSICALGIAGKSDMPWIFNSGVLVTGLLATLLAARERQAFCDDTRRRVLTQRQRQAIIAVTLLIALQLAVIALVPYDLSSSAKLVHNLAGWGSGWAMWISMLIAAVWIRDFDGRLYRATWVLASGLFGAFILFELGSLTWAQAELIALACSAGWTIGFFYVIEGRGEVSAHPGTACGSTAGPGS